MTKIREMRQSMTEAGVYNKADVNEICRLEEQYLKECKEIAEQCEAEGYPSHGENYELRCAEARKQYDEQIEIINANYEM